VTTALERPVYACAVCPPPRRDNWVPAEPGIRTCLECKDQLGKDLEEIESRYAELDPAPARQPGDGVQAKLGFGSKPPASDHIIAMRDARSSQVARVWVGSDGRVHREDQTPVLSVFGTLDIHAQDVAEGLGQDVHGCATVTALCDWLAGELDWITRHEMVAEFAADLGRLVRQLRPATGYKRYPIGRCPGVEDEVCEARLYVPSDSEEISCGACGATWPRPVWEQFGRDLMARAAS
jgi:hypothetical protein